MDTRSIVIGLVSFSAVTGSALAGSALDLNTPAKTGHDIRVTATVPTTARFAAHPVRATFRPVRVLHTVADTGTLKAASEDTLTVRDPIQRLQADIDAGRVQLTHDSITGYLPAMLKALKIPVSTQGLVFSRTSLQTDLIAPWSPRALYFNDDTYLGYVQGSDFLEIATISPYGGAVFYTFDQDPEEKPLFKRDETCTSCHRLRQTTAALPGFLMTSAIADKNGYVLTTIEGGRSTDATPVQDRFGGWYVTGTIANKGVHSGNVKWARSYTESPDRAQVAAQLDMHAESQRTDLSDKFDTKTYLSGHSDLAALMVFAHEVETHNVIAALHDASAKALREDSAVSRYYKDTTFAQTKVITSPRFLGAVEQAVNTFLFVRAAPLDGAITGTSTFTKDFKDLGPFDKKGRTVRELDLKTRLFKYPMSYMIYSESFDVMPQIAREAVYARLYDVLRGKDTSGLFDEIPAEQKKAILGILLDTKPEFAKYTKSR